MTAWIAANIAPVMFASLLLFLLTGFPVMSGRIVAPNVLKVSDEV